MAKVSLTWIQISDLHWGPREHKARFEVVKQRWQNDLRKMVKYVGSTPDLLLFTGDLSNSGQHHDLVSAYEQTTRVVEDTFQKGVRVFAVPGNHDVVRPATSEEQARLHWLGSDDESFRSEICKPTSALNKQVCNLFSGWDEFHSKKIQPHWSDGKPGILPGDFSATIEVANHRVLLVGLNSAWRQYTAGPFHGRLEVLIDQFVETLPFELRNLRAQCTVALLLQHHPPSWLRNITDWEQNIEKMVDAVLYGHEHEHKGEVVNSEQGTTRRLECMSLFGQEHFLDQGATVEIKRRFGYRWGKLSFLGTHVKGTTWARHCDDRLMEFQFLPGISDPQAGWQFVRRGIDASPPVSSQGKETKSTPAKSTPAKGTPAVTCLRVTSPRTVTGSYEYRMLMNSAEEFSAGPLFVHDFLAIDWSDSFCADVMRFVKESATVVVGTAGLDPDVMYCLGFRHGSGRQAIVVAPSRHESPPLVHNFETIFYPAEGGCRAVVREDPPLPNPTRQLEVTGNTCLVILPLEPKRAKDQRLSVDRILIPALAKANNALTVHTADTILAEHGRQALLSCLRECPLVVCDIGEYTPENIQPDVMYMAGFRRASGKPMLVFSASRTGIPFLLHLERPIMYSTGGAMIPVHAVDRRHASILPASEQHKPQVHHSAVSRRDAEVARLATLIQARLEVSAKPEQAERDDLAAVLSQMLSSGASLKALKTVGDGRSEPPLRKATNRLLYLGAANRLFAPDEALTVLGAAAQDSDDVCKASAQFEIGSAHLALGAWSEARSSFHKAMSGGPPHIRRSCQVMVAFCHIAEGQRNMAKPLLADAQLADTPKLTDPSGRWQLYSALYEGIARFAIRSWEDADRCWDWIQNFAYSAERSDGYPFLEVCVTADYELVRTMLARASRKHKDIQDVEQQIVNRLTRLPMKQQQLYGTRRTLRVCAETLRACNPALESFVALSKQWRSNKQTLGFIKRKLGAFLRGLE